MDDWFTDAGATGELEIKRRDGNWFVATSPGDTDIKCMIQDEELVDEEQAEQHVEATVSKFRQGMNGRDSYLFLTSLGSETESSEDKQRERNFRNQNQSETHSVSYANETWDLEDFSDSGEYVNVEATIDAVFHVSKDKRGIPDIKGELTDDSVWNPVTFIVNDGTSHPYLEEGQRFLFTNVKDHYYKKQAEAQVVINKNTDFVER